MPSPNQYPAVSVENLIKIFQIPEVMALALRDYCEPMINWKQDSHDAAMGEFWALSASHVQKLRS